MSKDDENPPTLENTTRIEIVDKAIDGEPSSCIEIDGRSSDDAGVNKQKVPRIVAKDSREESQSLATFDFFPYEPEVPPESLSPDFAAAVEQSPAIDGLQSVHFQIPLRDEMEHENGAHRYERGGEEPLISIPERLQIPRRLGTYEILEEIGHSASTVVYLARDVTSWVGRKVVLKIPTRQQLNHQWRHRIRSEAKVWKFLSESRHPNVVNFEDLKQVDSFTFFVMEYMDGGNLSAAIGRLPEPDKGCSVIAALAQICEGLAFAHSKRVVHGDIKPQNILVSGDMQRVKLGDFGLSFLRDDIPDDARAKKKLSGTLRFLAPECFTDGNKTQGSDIFALGVSLFYLLTGEYPFSPISNGYTPEDLAAYAAEIDQFRHTRKDPPLEIPSWLYKIITCCLALQPHDRFANAQELLEAIISFTNPAKSPRTVLTAWRNAEQDTIDYELEVQGQRSRELLTTEVTHQVIEGLCQLWDAVSNLALERKEAIVQGRSTLKMDERIRDLLHMIGEGGAHQMLGAKVLATLKRQRTTTLWFLHDPRLAAIPWEVLKVGPDHLCRIFPLTRWPKLFRGHSPVVLPDEEQEIRMLLIADPGNNLPMAHAECQQLRKKLEAFPISTKVKIEVVDHSINSFIIRHKMRQCHIVHYAGHAVFAEEHGDLSRSGWVLKGDPGDPAAPEPMDLLRASALGDLWEDQAPLLVFANACVSGRSSPRTLRTRVYSDAAMGFAQASLAAGVANYIGTTADIPDDQATVEFASIFYREFFTGHTVSQALLTARKHCVQVYGEEDLTWARYVAFGDPFTRIPLSFSGSK